MREREKQRFFFYYYLFQENVKSVWLHIFSVKRLDNKAHFTRPILSKKNPNGECNLPNNFFWMLDVNKLHHFRNIMLFAFWSKYTQYFLENNISRTHVTSF